MNTNKTSCAPDGFIISYGVTVTQGENVEMEKEKR